MALALFINILLLGMVVNSCSSKNLPGLLVGQGEWFSVK